MRGDFTRDTRERASRLSTRAVLLQQGRQLLDADWNAQAGLSAARAERAAVDTIGRQGAPREDAGFEIRGGNGTLTIDAGSLYVEGLRCQNAAQIGYAEQLAADLLPTLTDVLSSGAEGLVYLEASTRPATEADDALLLEPGLGGADTVVQEIAQWVVRVAALGSIGMTREPLITAIDRNRSITLKPWARTTGGLAADVQTEDEATDPGPCEMPATAGYLDQVNRLFHIEIHQSGLPGTATFKWAEDGGAEAGLRSEGSGFVIDLPPQRAAEQFPTGAFVEIISRDRQRVGEPGSIGQITSAPGTALVIDGVPVNAADPLTYLRLRRWAELPQVIPTGGDWVALSRGVKVRFAPAPQHYQHGAGWTVPARTRTGDILWPPYTQPDLTVALGDEGAVGFFAPSDGQRRYAALALVKRGSDTSFTVTRDLRQVFAPLTDLTADLVRYDNTDTQLAATDVQAAISELAWQRGDHCTLSAHTGKGWEEVFSRIPTGGNATICLPVGNYPLSAPVEIRGKGHVRVIGAGPGSKVWSYGNTAALLFRDCRSVELQDLTVAAENRSPWKPRKGSMTTGAVDVAQCGSVRLERATLIAGGTRWRQAACLRVDAGAGAHWGGGDVVVTDCDIVVGDLACGILLLNTVTARVRDNRIRPRREEPVRTVQRWVDDPMVSASMGRLLFSHSAVEGELEWRRRRSQELFSQCTIALGRSAITFFTLSCVADVWPEFADEYAHRVKIKGMSPHEVRSDIRTLTGNLWATRGDIQTAKFVFKGFRRAYSLLSKAIGPVIDTGIVVAGASGGDIAVSGNAIDGALQGVRVAISNGTSNKLTLRSVRVERNTIRLAVTPLDRPRHGIYLGNAERAWIVDNDIAIETADRPSERAKTAAAMRLDHLHSEGIRVYGVLGLMLQVRGNVVQGCSDGITVWSYTNPRQHVRLLDGNMIAGASMPWRIYGGATRVNNTPE